MDDSSFNPDRVLIDELQQQLIKSAEIGKHLLEEQETLREQMETQRKDYTKQIEDGLQENYSLRHKLEMQLKLNDNLVQENETVLEEQQKKTSLMLQQLEDQNAKQVKALVNEKTEINVQVDKLQLEVKNHLEKIAQQTEYIEELTDKLQMCSEGTTDTHEDTTQMTQYIGELEQKTKMIEMSLLDSQTAVKVLTLEKESMESKIVSLMEDVDDRTQQASEWYQSLQAAQEETNELKAEIENLKMELDSDERAESGNSLFAEVEDKRIAAERKLISFEAKNGSLEKAYQVARQQIKKHKVELMSLLCRYSGEVADAAYVRSLNKALAQSKAEVEALSIRLSKAEQQEHNQMQQIKDCYDAFTNSGADKKPYIKFLENEIDQLKNEKVSMAKELEKKRKQLIIENDNLQETKFQLRSSEQRCLKLTCDLSKCRQKTDEVEEKHRKEVAVHKDLELQIQLLEERLAARKAGKKGRRSLNPSVSAPSAVVKVEEKEKEIPKVEEVCTSKAPTLSAEEATERFIAELKQEMNLKKMSAVSKGTENVIANQKDPLTGAVSQFERKPLTQHNSGGRPTNKVISVADNKVNQCPQQ